MNGAGVAPVAAIDGGGYAMKIGLGAKPARQQPNRQGMTMIHLDDFAPGQVHALGRHTLSRDEIVAFARAWDPQPFHLDEEAAGASIYRG
jgi:acyl dehydratase